MDFNFTDEQLAFRDTARQFADKELAPFAAEWDQHGIFPKDTIRRAGELGFCALYCDEDQGGMGLSRLDAALIFEQMAAGCTSTTAFITIHNMATWMLSRFGSEAVRQRWNGPLMSGEALASYCLTEPGAGSDAASLKTSARRDGDEYVLNGAKAFISGAGDTDLLVLMARTGGPGAGGISCFAIPADTPGVSYGRNEDKMGWKSQPTRAVILEDARVPVENRIGDEGQGFKIAMAGLDGGRINIASCSLGAASAALAQAQSYVQERRQFDQPVSEFQSVQFTLADMATHLVAAQQMVRLAAWKLHLLRHGQAARHRPVLRRLQPGPAAARRLRLHQGVPAGALCARQPGASDSGRHQRNHAGDHRPPGTERPELFIRPDSKRRTI